MVFEADRRDGRRAAGGQDADENDQIAEIGLAGRVTVMSSNETSDRSRLTSISRHLQLSLQC